MNTKLTDLIKKDEEIKGELLAEALFPYMNFTESGELLPSESFKKLSSKAKVLVVLLSGVALLQLGIRQTDRMAPKDVVEMSAIPAGTVRPALKELLEEKVVAIRNGEYQIPPRSFSDVKRLIEEG